MPRQMRRGRRLVIALSALAVTAAVATMPAAGDAPDITPVNATLTVTGDGSVSYAPDTASLSFSASTQKATAQGAVASNATLMNGIIAALKGAGAKDVSTSSVSLSIRYTQDGSAITGFEADNTVEGTTDVSHVGALLDAAVKAGATTVNNLAYSSTGDTEGRYRQALAAAIVQARGRATAMAQAAGVTLGRLVSIEPSSAYQNTAVPAGMAPSASSTPVVAPPQNVTASVTLVYAVS